MHATKSGNSGADVMTPLVDKNPPHGTFVVVAFFKGSSEETVPVNFGLEYPYTVRGLCQGPLVWVKNV